MLLIHKYAISVTDNFTVTMPIGATILHIDMQKGMPHMWVLVNTDYNMTTRNFRVFDTGQAGITYDMSYIGTFIMSVGNYVGHLYEIM